MTHAAEIDADADRFPAAELRRWKVEAERYMREQVSKTTPTRAATASMIAIGPDVIATGRVLRTHGTDWRLQIDEFVMGDVAALRHFSESFSALPQADCFFVMEREGTGRMLMAPPAIDLSGPLIIDLQVAAPLPRSEASALHDANRLGLDIALNLSGEAPDLDPTFRTISGVEVVPQRLMIVLSTGRGDWGFDKNAGSRVGELYHRFTGARIEQFIALETIRLATVPWQGMQPNSQHVSLGFIEKVHGVRIISLPKPASREFLKAALTLDIYGMSPGLEFVIPISTSIAHLKPRPKVRLPHP